jgi:hypothetical protein
MNGTVLENWPPTATCTSTDPAASGGVVHVRLECDDALTGQLAPPTLTVAPLTPKFDPLMVRLVPPVSGPLVGERPAIAGAE